LKHCVGGVFFSLGVSHLSVRAIAFKVAFVSALKTRIISIIILLIFVLVLVPAFVGPKSLLLVLDICFSFRFVSDQVSGEHEAQASNEGLLLQLTIDADNLLALIKV